MVNYTNKFFLSLFLAFLSFTATASCSQDLFTCLTSHGVGNITTYYSPTYFRLLEASIQNLRFAEAAINKPIAIVIPVNKQQVSSSIRCARAGSWRIKVRSGGHSYEGLSSYEETPFVLIDLMNLNRVTVDLESETAWVEGGATLGEIYHAIAMSSDVHAFSAGLCSTVGSGGHISGGGYGALVRKHGLAADNVVDAIVVDSEGGVRDRKAMGQDVFWAIRGGGGGNFGAVVAWKIRLLKVPKTVAAFVVTRSGNTKEIAELWHKWQMVAPNLEDNFYLQALVRPGDNTKSKTLVNMSFMGLYLGSTSSALSSINKAFPQLGLSAPDCKNLSWVEAIILLRGDPNVRKVADLQNRFSYQKTFHKSKADFVKVPISKKALRGALEMVAEQPKGSLLLDPYGGVNDRIQSNAIPFPHRVGNLYGIEYFVNWDQEGGDGSYMDWIRKIYTYMTPYVAKNPRTVYVNNVDLDLGVMDWRNCTVSGPAAVETARSWGEKYFLGNYDRLVRVKTMIDPDNVFRHPQSIPPLVSLY